MVGGKYRDNMFPREWIHIVVHTSRVMAWSIGRSGLQRVWWRRDSLLKCIGFINLALDRRMRGSSLPSYS
jgi:hypothetical protein